MFITFFVLFVLTCTHRDLHVLTHYVPTRRSADLLTPGTDASRHQCIVARPQQIGLVGADAAVAGPEADIDPHLARLDRVVRYERGYAIGEFDPLGAQSGQRRLRHDRPRRAELR